jgi:hypothetical protein
MGLGIDLKPLERGMDALVRMADALERIATVAEFAEDEYRSREGQNPRDRAA